MQRHNFEGRFLSKLSKIDRKDIESFLGHLVREKNFLEVIFNSLADGIVVLRPSLEVMYTNDAALELLNLTNRRRIIGERISELVPQAEFRDLVARFAIQREPVSGIQLEMPVQPPRWVDVSIIPLDADAGQVAGSVIMVLRDATQAREMEEGRRRAERASAFATLAAGLAHEIKNPLNSLQIHAQLLQRALRDPHSRGKKIDWPRLAQSSDIIVDEIRRLSRVVNEFLTAVRPTRPLIQRGNINTHMERIVAMMRPEAEERGIALRVVLDHEIPPVDFDPAQMTQAVVNLLKNAFEAVSGRPDPTVELRTRLDEASFIIRIADNGPGIPEDHLRRILEPYFTTKETGTGLGLAIVSRIVEEHGGRLDMASKPGEGTAVSMIFPLETRPVRLLETATSPAAD
ncbi:MAG: ATP-binding protein [Candidatus Sumerlaeaceae bacterium]|nr:ATP-binding protein [Candidatus Sumerlaeaceae bacterium]